MIVRSGRFGQSSHCAPAVVAIDVEWQKNYRIKDGNKAFCYSLVWVSMPSREPGSFGDLGYRYKSVYLEPDEDAAALAERLDRDVRRLLADGVTVVGHQLCSDLSVVERNGNFDLPAVGDARVRWRSRRGVADRPTFVDTRFDIDHLLAGPSRRLVDVCNELGLDVEQPELRSKSMTALHREWVTHGSLEARERIAVLNLRHSLSSAVLALHARGTLRSVKGESVNDLLYPGIRRNFAYAESPQFTALLSRRGR